MKKNTNFLTKNKNYVYLLFTIGKSPKYLTGSEIKTSFVKIQKVKTEQQTYEMINYLNPYPLDRYGICLFDWNTITKDTKQQINTLEILKKYFNLDWTEEFDKENVTGSKKLYITFEKSSKKEIIIKNIKEPDTVIKIKKNIFLMIGNLTIISGREEKKFRLYSKGHFIYYLPPYLYKKINILDKFYYDPPRYLDVKLEDKSGQTLLSIEQRMFNLNKQKNKNEIILNNLQSNDEITNLYWQIDAIYTNNKSYAFQLNIRGLLLYIAGEIELEKKEGRINNSRISIILENLSINFLSMFPFLQFYTEFRHEFTKNKDILLEYKYFEVKLMKEITKRLEIHLGSSDINFLEYYVSKIYCKYILYHLIYLIDQRILSNNNELINMIKIYQINNLKFLTSYLNKEKKMLEKHYNYLQTDPTSNEIIVNTKTFIDNFLEINKY